MRSCRRLAVLAIAGVMLAACQTGRGRVVSPADIAVRDGWLLVEGVPFVAQRSERDCGAAALAMVLRYWGVPADADGLAAAVPAARGRGLKAGELQELARARGLDAFVVKGEPADLRTEIERRRPLIVGLAQRAGRDAIGHYEVVIGFDHARRSDPDARPGGRMAREQLPGLRGGVGGRAATRAGGVPPRALNVTP